MGLGIPPLGIKIMLESNPLVLVRILAVREVAGGGRAASLSSPSAVKSGVQGCGV